MADVARETMLARVRGQLAGPAVPAVDVVSEYRSIERNYERQGKRSAEETIELFIDRLLDYDAQVVRASDAGVSAAASEMLKAAGHTRLLAPAAVPEAWLPSGVEILRDRGSIDYMLSHVELDGIHAVLTTCAVAIATTGTVLLQHTVQEGRRALTLVPDYYLCIVRASQIVETVPEGLAHIESPQIHPITTVSGPSATSDIEMTRIRGVHGPRHLGIVIVDGI